MTARSFFVAKDGRLHAPWRILLFLLVAVVCVVAVGLALEPLRAPLNRLAGGARLGLPDALFLATGLLLAHLVMLRWVDRAPWSYVGLHREAARWRLLLGAWWLGAWTIAVPSLLLFGTGLLTVVASAPGSWWLSAVRVTMALIPAAFEEELLTRGYIFAAIREWLGRPTALLLTSVGFGLLHLANPGADAWSIVMVTLAGVFLGVVLLATGSLYAAWMAHWSWNWVMAVPMHVEVSGLALSYPDYRTIETGPDWITGGPWGPEGGVAAAVGMTAGLAYLYWRHKRQTADPSSPASRAPGSG